MTAITSLVPLKPSKYSVLEKQLHHPSYREIHVNDQPIVQLHQQNNIHQNNSNANDETNHTDKTMSSKGEVHTISMLHRTSDIKHIRTSIQSNTAEYDNAMNEYRMKRLVEKRTIRANRHKNKQMDDTGIVNSTRSALVLPTANMSTDNINKNNTAPSNNNKKYKSNHHNHSSNNNDVSKISSDSVVPVTAPIKHQRKKDETQRQLERLQRKQARLQLEQSMDSNHHDTQTTDNNNNDGMMSSAAVVHNDNSRIVDEMRLDGSKVMIIDTSSSSESSSSDGDSDADNNNSNTADSLKQDNMCHDGYNDGDNIDTLERPAWMYRGQQIDLTLQYTTNELQHKLSLDSNISTILHQHNINKLFAMQSHVIPILCQNNVSHDICVCSPTGTGKTLTYVIPIIHKLSKYISTRLRCIVILPTRDLAQQVHSVFNWFTKSYNIHIALCIGQHSFVDEQYQLINQLTNQIQIDVMICTPGRLIEHIQHTKYFNLSYLNILVLDEVDRLLTQNYNDFIYKVIQKTNIRSHDSDRNDKHIPNQHLFSNNRLHLDIHQHHPPTVQKLLFSATLTTNPQKLTALQLNAPLFYTETKYNKIYKVNVQLAEYVIQCTMSNKLMKLILLLQQLQSQQILIFTKSLDATHRLCRTLELYGIPNIAEYTSNIQSSHISNTNSILYKFNHKTINILVCSDVMARGIDFHTTIDCVIQYDVPIYARTYIHRVGRTARAGITGTAYTLCTNTEYNRFIQLLQQIENSNIQPYTILDIETVPIKEQVQQVLIGLHYVVQQENTNKIDCRKPLQNINDILDHSKSVELNTAAVDTGITEEQ